MRELSQIDDAEIREMLAKSWLTHDGMWFLSAFRELGIEAASALNLSAIRALSAVEVARTKRLLAVSDDELADFRGLVEFMQSALRLTMPSSVLGRALFSSEEEGIIKWEWEDGECFAFKGMKALGVEAGYDCGVMFRISCWLDALGIAHEVVPALEGCMMMDTGKCAGEFRLTGLQRVPRA